MKDSPATAYLGLGSNLGDRMKNLREALRLLSEETGLVAISPVYETEPEGVSGQPEFLNMACEIQSHLSPEELLLLAKRLERKLGRPPNGHNSPRPIDIDILVYGETVTIGPGLTIPHPRLSERAFVLVPLSDIAPELRVPPDGRTVIEMLHGLDKVTGKIKKVGVIDVPGLDRKRV